jgi:hypothetical protein
MHAMENGAAYGMSVVCLVHAVLGPLKDKHDMHLLIIHVAKQHNIFL